MVLAEIGIGLASRLVRAPDFKVVLRAVNANVEFHKEIGLSQQNRDFIRIGPSKEKRDILRAFNLRIVRPNGEAPDLNARQRPGKISKVSLFLPGRAERCAKTIRQNIYGSGRVNNAARFHR